VNSRKKPTKIKTRSFKMKTSSSSGSRSSANKLKITKEGKQSWTV
jgi:hypothetical protein